MSDEIFINQTPIENVIQVNSTSNNNNITIGQGVSLVVSVNNKIGAVVISPSDIGLGNVDNTSDLNKPISNATLSALFLKTDISLFNTLNDIVTGNYGSWNDATITLTYLSGDWNSVFSNVNLLSSNWNSVYSEVQNNSALWMAGGNNSLIQELSSHWNDSYTIVNLNSSNWNSVYSYVNQNSSIEANQQLSTTFVINNSSNITNTNTLVNNTSSNWNSVYSYVNQNSSTQANQQLATNFVISNSSNILSVDSLVNSTSSHWNSVYSYVNQNSGVEANQQLATTFILNNSSNILSVDSLVNSTSSHWNDSYTNVNSNSANWQSAYTDVISNSANWINGHIAYSNLIQNSAIYQAISSVNGSTNQILVVNDNHGKISLFLPQSIVTPGDLNVTGSLYVAGTGFQLNTNTITLSTPILYINNSLSGINGNVYDIGIVGHFKSGIYQHTGLVRSALSGIWTLFSGLTTEPDNGPNLNYNDPTFTIDTLRANILGSLSGNVVGNITGNAGSVTNGVYTTGTYSDPSWITSISDSKIQGTSRNSWDSVYSYVNQNSGIEANQQLTTTFVIGNSSNITEVNTLVNNNSANWQNSYNVSTTYQNASGSFATNTLLQTTSALLTPLTLTNTLTSQLVTKTDADSKFLPLSGGSLTGALNTNSLIATTSAISSLNSQITLNGTAAGYGFSILNKVPFDPGQTLTVDGRGRVVHGMTFTAGITNFANGSDHSHVQWTAQNRSNWQMIQNGDPSASNNNAFVLTTVGPNANTQFFNDNNIYSVDSTAVSANATAPYLATGIKINYNTNLSPNLTPGQFIQITFNPGAVGIVANTYSGTVSAGPIPVTIAGTTKYQYIFSLENFSSANWNPTLAGTELVYLNASNVKNVRVAYSPTDINGIMVGLTGNYLNIPRYVLVEMTGHDAYAGETVILKITTSTKINLPPADYNAYVKHVIDANRFVLSVGNTRQWFSTSGTTGGTGWGLYKGSTDGSHQYTPALQHFYYQRFPTSDVDSKTTGGSRNIALGNSAEVDADFSYALGYKSSIFPSTTSGSVSAAAVLGGENNIVYGNNSTAVGGIGLIASGSNQFITGKYNSVVGTNSTPLIVGWGSSDANRSNLLELNPNQLTVSTNISSNATVFANSISGTHFGDGSNLSGLAYTLNTSNFAISPKNVPTDIATGNFSYIGNGSYNTASGLYTHVGGGRCNTASGDYSTVVNGLSSCATGTSSVVVGGCKNCATGASSIIIGGLNNRACGFCGLIGTGQTNVIAANTYNSFIGSGVFNTICTTQGNNAAIIGGCNNTVTSTFGIVVGGKTNTTSGNYSSIVGGLCNTASGSYSTITNGFSSCASGNQAFVGSGSANIVSGVASAIVGGQCHCVCAGNSFIGGGLRNTIQSNNNYCAGIVAGNGNVACGAGAFIGAGLANVACNAYASVVGGIQNCANGNSSAILGGGANIATGSNSIVGGGAYNISSGAYSSILGGRYNTASGVYSSILGGRYNTASGVYSVIDGGSCNTNSSRYSFIAAGSGNDTRGFNNTFILGTKLSAVSANFTYTNNISTQGNLYINNNTIDNYVTYGGGSYSIPFGFTTQGTNLGSIQNTVASNSPAATIGFGASPTAGANATSYYTNSYPSVILPGTNTRSGNAGGYGATIDFITPFTWAFGFNLNGTGSPSLSAYDSIIRFNLGASASFARGTNSAEIGGVQSGPGFGLRLSRYPSTSPLSANFMQMYLYSRTISNTTNITNATNSTPITASTTGGNHNLSIGNLVEITGVQGNTATNGIWTVSNTTAQSIELAGSVGNGAYTSGGTINRLSTNTAPIPIYTYTKFFVNYPASVANSLNTTFITVTTGFKTNTPILSLSGHFVTSTGSFQGQSFPLTTSIYSITDNTPYASYVVSNMAFTIPGYA